MSAVLGLFGDRAQLADGQVAAMLRAMGRRGSERMAIWRDADAVLAVGRYNWELDADFSGGALVAADHRYVVAADASVYYRRELHRVLAERDIAPAGDSPAELILAAVRAWGTGWTDYVEGDFAAIVWDRVRGEALAFRDFAGKRPLHYAELGRDLIVASTIGGVVAHPACPSELNGPVLAASAAGLIFSAGPETAYSAVKVLPNAHRLRWSTRGVSAPIRFWEPPIGRGESATSHEEAAHELRETLAIATRERMSRSGPSTVWMSGGWDSSAVFAAAQQVSRDDGFPLQPAPISISYPVGDPGREDELIQAIAEHWDSPVHWIDIGTIPFFHDEIRRAAERDEPYAHLYERWNGALAAGSRACGARIALDGNGGDQLFQNSDVFLADLLRRGRWVSLAREWPARPRGGFREFFAAAIQPNLGPAALRAAKLLRRGRPLRHYLDRGIPAWIQPDFAARHRLAERDHELLGRPVKASHAEREIDWQFTCLFISRAFSKLGEFALERGVELRSPLSDRRVIELALSRPWWERSSGSETKVLLRRAMRGLLPDSVLAPRPRRTGITAGYSHRWMRDVFPALLAEALQRPLLLEQMGIVSRQALIEASAAYPRRGDSSTRVNLFYTLQTELWLRERQGKVGDRFGSGEAVVGSAPAVIG